MDIKIREATNSDYLAIHYLNSSSFGYDYDLENTRMNLEYILSKPYCKVFVATKDNEVVGYIHGSDYATMYSPSLKNIMALAVDKPRQGKGIGKKLLFAIED